MKKILFIFTLVTCSSILNSQDGTFDPTFNSGGSGIGNGTNSAYINETLLQPDGKLLVAGQISSFNGIPTRSILRLNPDGTLDTTFNNNILALTENITQVEEIALQSDGKIILGDFFVFNGTSNVNNEIMRLNSDGTKDNSFNYTGNDFDIYDIKVQSDNKIILAVNSGITGTNINRLVRLNSTGTVDLTFNNTLLHWWNSAPGEIFILPNDDILLFGGLFNFRYGNGTTIPYKYTRHLIKFSSNGNYDPTFNANNGYELSQGGINTVALTSDNKLIIGGYWNTIYKNQTKKGLMRLYSDGSYDSTFNQDIGLNSGFINDIKIQTDQKIIFAGSYENYNNTVTNDITRVDSNGVLDNAFSSGTGLNGAQNESRIRNIHLLNDGKILISGDFNSYNSNSVKSIARISKKSTLSINESTTLYDELFVFPNPIEEILNINSKSKIKEISIIDINGKLVFNTQLNENEIKLNLEKLVSGNYFIKIRNSNEEFIVKKIAKK